MATRKIGPALAAGCTVVLKPASETPLTALALRRAPAARPASRPASSTCCRPGAPARSSRRCCTTTRRPQAVLHRLDRGRAGRCSSEAADQVVNCSMELGGNAPFVVFADADLDAAVDGAMVAKMRNGGEACTAANRFYVEASVAEEFSAAPGRARWRALRGRSGHRRRRRRSARWSTPGRVDKVAELVEASGRRGGDRADGRQPPRPDRAASTRRPCCPGWRPDDPILDEEIFGPVAPVVTFADEEEAIALANDTEFGLVAYVYTGDLARGPAGRRAHRGGHGRASTAGSSPTRPRRSAASSRAGSAARAATRACSSSSRQVHRRRLVAERHAPTRRRPPDAHPAPCGCAGCAPPGSARRRRHRVARVRR